jgi:ribonucleotide reductase alpha subunit
MGLWTDDVRNQIIADKGSVQNVRCIPQEIKDLYKTVWEIKQKVIIDMAADRGAFICQSQSLNIHMAEPSTARLTSMHFYAWKKGLKTGMYYLRTRPKADAIQFTVDQTALMKTKNEPKAEERHQTPPRRISGTPDRDHPTDLKQSKSESVIGNSNATQGLDYEAEVACESCSA